MTGAPSRDLEWHEQIARRLEASRNRPIRIRDLIGAVVVTAVVLGLGRSAVRSIDTPGGQAPTSLATWLALTAAVGVVAILGVVAALGFGRVSTSLHSWGKARPDLFGSIALAIAVFADLLAFGLLMAIALAVALYLMISLLYLFGAFS